MIPASVAMGQVVVVVVVVPVVVDIPLQTCDEHQAVVEQLGQVVATLPEIYHLFLLPFCPLLFSNCSVSFPASSWDFITFCNGIGTHVCFLHFSQQLSHLLWWHFSWCWSWPPAALCVVPSDGVLLSDSAVTSVGGSSVDGSLSVGARLASSNLLSPSSSCSISSYCAGLGAALVLSSNLLGKTTALFYITR